MDEKSMVYRVTGESLDKVLVLLQRASLTNASYIEVRDAIEGITRQTMPQWEAAKTARITNSMAAKEAAQIEACVRADDEDGAMLRAEVGNGMG